MKLKVVEIRSRSGNRKRIRTPQIPFRITGLHMDKIINYLLLTIISFFRSFSHIFSCCCNFAFEQLKPKVKTIEKVVEVPVEIEKPLEVYGEIKEKNYKTHPSKKKAQTARDTSSDLTITYN